LPVKSSSGVIGGLIVIRRPDPPLRSSVGLIASTFVASVGAVVLIAITRAVTGRHTV
jgi:hypothetical protein